MLSLTPPTLDMLVIGGGINGTGIAADAAGRGLSVLLCEQSDLASATSSASSKLIHGGLRYLEHYEFRLVKEALAEREVLLHNAPHLVQPLRFTLPHRPHLRPYLMIRSGLFLYDNLSKRNTLPGTKGIKFGINSPLKAEMKKGLQYSDCWVDDARLVVANALSAQRNGARILTQTRFVNAERLTSENLWKVTLQDVASGQETIHHTKSLVNAGGPWVTQIIKDGLGVQPSRGIRLIKGSHIIVPKIHNEEGAYILQNTDKRIVFVIPYQGRFSLIGTTDKEYKGDPATVSIDSDEVEYLIKVVNEHFVHQIKASDVISSYSGVRPLCDDESSDPSAITRDYTMEVEDFDGKMPLLSVFGGKITTYRKLAEAALEKLRPYFNQLADGWTAHAPLPGATHATKTLSDIQELVKEIHPWLPQELMLRLSRSYGVMSLKLLAGAKSLEDLGKHFGANLYEKEVEYLCKTEWAKTAEDILWRRSKLGLFFTAQEVEGLQTYLSEDPQQQSLASNQ
ncbi:MAG: glycerol-3-phosphate dehydrogenase [Hahellaceae bacterium]|nr:glycerol-3-phosphate dehydrogenase [Hahellaceae bacterium]